MASRIAKEDRSHGDRLRGELERILLAWGVAQSTILLAGGVAQSTILIDWVGAWVAFVPPVEIRPRVEKVKALALGALRVLRREEDSNEYGALMNAQPVGLPGALPVGPLRSLADLARKARSRPTRIVVIAAAQDEVALEAAAQAEEEGLARCILVGDQHRIEAILWDLERDPRDYQIVNRQELEEAVGTAVELVRNGEGHVLMKGKVTSGELMREVVDRERGLRTDHLLSDVFIFDSPLPGEPRILGITDAGVHLTPDLETKTGILENAVGVFRRLDYERPKVAVLSAMDSVNPDMPSTWDAAELARRARQGAFGACEVDGPLAMDLAISAEAVRKRGVQSKVAGAADILLFPSIEAANLTANALQYMVPLEPAHVVVGASAPVLIPSGAESVQAKVNAVALGRMMVD